MVYAIEDYDKINIGKIKRIYVCAPVKGDQDDSMVIRENIQRAALYSRDVSSYGFLPICPHIYLGDATGLNEVDRPGDRDKAIRLGLELLTISDELWVYGRRCGKESTGMKGEIELAFERKMPVRYRDIYSDKL